MTPGLASATQHRPAHLLLGQCPLPVTFQMAVLILPTVKDSESHWFSRGSGWRSFHTLCWDSTTKSTRGCEGRGSRLRLRFDSKSGGRRRPPVGEARQAEQEGDRLHRRQVLPEGRRRESDRRAQARALAPPPSATRTKRTLYHP